MDYSSATCFENGYALIIGVGNYTEQDINPLPVTADDATVLYNLLTDEKRAGYPINQVKLLTNEAARHEGIISGLDWLINITRQNPRATVLVYYSGHGGNKNDQYLLMPQDFTWGRYKTRGITKEEFSGKINQVTAHKMMIFLDCCHAGGITSKGIREQEFLPSNEALYQQLDGGKGRIVVASSRAAQLSYILPHARYSVFTDVLIDALDGAADDGSGYATALRTLSHLSEQVKLRMNSIQVPVFNLEGVEDFPVCRVNTPGTVNKPFKKTAAYLGIATGVEIPPEELWSPLELFKLRLNKRLEEWGFAGVPDVIMDIQRSAYDYKRSELANIISNGSTPLAALSPNDYIVRLRIFISSIIEK